MSISVWCECGEQFDSLGGNAGDRVPCPACGREIIVPGREPLSDAYLDAWDPGPSSTSRKAIASLVLGLLFVFACLSGLPAILFGFQALRNIDRSAGRLRGRGMAVAGIVLGVIGCLFTIALIMPMFRSAGAAAERAMCTNNLKQIGLALHNYHEAFGSLPPAAITGKDGRPLLSWRVAILPYMEAGDLYARFHLDEPWDSPHNLALLVERPLAYGCPGDRALKPGMTGYMAVIGKETAFTPDFQPVKLSEITDGTSLTLLVGESRQTVPWTKPEDLPFDMSVPLSGMGSHHGYHNNGFNALLADGSVRFLKSSIDPSTVSRLITRDGNEAIEQDQY